jgi:3,4-dihydroxy 2-butanone 4-phosphate synthase/GTP cyclohydrolase II
MSSKSLEQALTDINNGKPIILVDGNKEDEGDFVLAGEKVSLKKLHFLTKYGNDMLCVVLEEDRLKRLGLVPESRYHNADGCRFWTSVDPRKKHADHSAQSKYDAIQALTFQNALISDERSRLKTPGHIRTLCANAGGLSARRGHTEGSLTLIKLVRNLEPVAVITEVMDREAEEPRPMSLYNIQAFAQKHKLTTVTLKDILSYGRA